METSAMPTGDRWELPAKMTSSRRRPRSPRVPCSPSTQRRASATLVLPAPLGPTMAVTPGPNSKAVRVAKLLKPRSSRRFKYIPAPLPPSPSRFQLLHGHAGRLSLRLLFGGTLTAPQHFAVHRHLDGE